MVESTMAAVPTYAVAADFAAESGTLPSGPCEALSVSALQ
jgi:hypothetical protein